MSDLTSLRTEGRIPVEQFHTPWDRIVDLVDPKFVEHERFARKNPTILPGDFDSAGCPASSALYTF